MIDIISNVRLKKHLLFATSLTTAINKLSNDVADFGHVGMRRNVFSGGENKSGKRSGILLNDLFELA